MDAVKVGSRKSELALIQTNHVIALLKDIYPQKEFEIVKMSTLGDRVLNVSLPKIGEKSLFTKDLEIALENGSVDMVVHSLKDLPTTLPKGMAIGAVLEREDARDALVLREDFKGHTLATLPAGSIVGTSSLRRTAQLSRCYPHLKVVDIRGNLNTRLKKLDYHCKHANPADDTDADDKSGAVIPEYVALILAQAGLVRMGWLSRISQVLPCDEVLYAVGQGALAIECKADNDKILQMLAPLNHATTYCRILSERSFLKTLGGGCSAPVAVTTTLETNEDGNYSASELKITGAVWSLDGKIKIENNLTHIFEAEEEQEEDNNPPEDTENIVEEITRNKRSKHKLNAEEHHQDSKKNCPGIETKNGDTNSEVKCCRQTDINSTMEKFEPSEIENLVNVHGKLFMVCPFSDRAGGGCPVRLPVGVDIMAKCPVFSDDQERPYETVDLSETLVKLHPRKTSYDIKKCPFMANQLPALYCDRQSTIVETAAAQKCPFIKSDLVANQINDNDSSDSSGSSTDVCEVKLYCGLTKHFDLPSSMIDRCEQLGKELAESLIERGALEVMKCAQDHIRGAIPTTTTTDAVLTQ